MGSPITSLNAVNAILKLIAVEALTALEPALIMGSLVNRNFEASLAAVGDTVNVPIPPVMIANNIAEAGTIQNQNPSLGNAQITLNRHIEASFQIGDVAKALTNADLGGMYMRAAINALALKIETDLMNLYPLLTDIAPVGGAASISESVVDDAETALFDALVPQNEPKYLLVNSASYSDLRMLQKFSERSSVGDPATGVIMTGQVPGSIKGFGTFRSHHVAKPATTAYNLAFARDAFALVTRRLPQPLPGTGAISEYAEKAGFGLRVLTSYAHGTLGTQFTVDCLYGVGVLRSNFGVQVLTNT